MMIWGILIVIALLIAGGWYFSNTAIYPNTITPDDMRERELAQARFDAVAFAQWEKETITISSPHGYTMFGLYFPFVNATKTVIVVHGIGCNHYCSVKYAEVFRQLGFNLLLVDLRNHGYSGGDNTSFGYYEKYDIQTWVDWVLARCKNDYPDAKCFIGTHGESLGASTVLQHAAIDPRLDFVIADCPYASLADELTYRLKKEYHLPPFPLLPVASVINKLRVGFAFADVAPIDTITQVKAPVLFIHGEVDDYIPPQATLAMHAAKPEPKMLYMVPGADHAESLITAPDAYAQTVKSFLADIGVEVVRK